MLYLLDLLGDVNATNNPGDLSACKTLTVGRPQTVNKLVRMCKDSFRALVVRGPGTTNLASVNDPLDHQQALTVNRGSRPLRTSWN